jgi:hypothetical protein
VNITKMGKGTIAGVIVVVIVIIVVAFIANTIITNTAHAEDCKVRAEALNDESIWDLVLNYADYEESWDSFRIECADVYEFPNETS